LPRSALLVDPIADIRPAQPEQLIQSIAVTSPSCKNQFVEIDIVAGHIRTSLAGCCEFSSEVLTNPRRAVNVGE
jgi:hypothetical protein